jgi:hypothetical protein
MKYVVICTVAFLILFLFAYSKQSGSRMESGHSIADEQASSHLSPLTEAEEKDLSAMTGQVLRWTAQWQPGPHRFLKNGEVVSYSLPQLIKQYAGQEITLNVVLSETSVTVYLVPLHLKYRARRLYNIGLSNPHPEQLTEDTYEACIAEEARLEERLRAISETTSVQMSKATSALETSEEKRQEVRYYRIPMVAASPEKDLERDKKTAGFYEQLIALAQTSIKQSYCSAGKSFYLTVPEFHLSDPAIYLLVSSSHQQDIAVEWFDFYREINSGEFGAYHVKSVELPGERDYWATTIKQWKNKALKVTCAP